MDIHVLSYMYNVAFLLYHFLSGHDEDESSLPPPSPPSPPSQEQQQQTEPINFPHFIAVHSEATKKLSDLCQQWEEFDATGLSEEGELRCLLIFLSNFLSSKLSPNLKQPFYIYLSTSFRGFCCQIPSFLYLHV